MPSSLDPLLLQTQAGHDEFISEKYADQIAALLANWCTALLRSPQDLAPIATVLDPNLRAASPKPTGSHLVRSGAIEIRHNQFSSDRTLSADAFLAELRSNLGTFDQILTADLEVTAIDASSRPTLRTRIRYELVGTARSIYRRQRVGSWDLEWQQAPDDNFHLTSWQSLEETESHCSVPAYIDITSVSLGRNPSLSAQLAHGTDYWRTLLDGACGIDIYGHNGVSIGDIDNDGFDDLYICQPAGLPNRLFRNRGDGTFEDVTDSGGVGVIENTACALFLDVDNDGHQDLIVVRANGPLLFLNDGTGKFHQKANAFQFANPPQGTFVGAAAADYDRDGWLDIYFCLYVYYQGADQYKYPSPYFDANNGPPNFMMRNNRDATFRDVTAETGLSQNNTRYSFCCAWNDFNQDGWPDLYVVNDFGRKNLYRNNGNGTFTDIAGAAGVEDVGAGMSVCWFDYENNGTDDLYVANMWTAAGERITMQPEFKKNSPPGVRARYHKHAMGNSLFRNASGSAFTDTTDSSATRVGRWSWSSDSFDFDHDGFPDLYVTNGMVSSPNKGDLNSFFWRQVVAKSPDQPRSSHDYEQGWSAINELIRADHTWSGYERNIFYANNGDGTFSDISGSIGLDFIEDARSFALADFDRDGRQEIFLKNRNAPQLRLLKNVLPDLPRSIVFCLRGTKSNRDAIGSVVTIKTEDGKQTRSIQAGSGFLAQHSKEVFFGLGRASGLVTATIRWPSGLVQEFPNLPASHRFWIEEGAPAPTRLEPFRAANIAQNGSVPQQPTESLPASAETWLLAPIAAPDFSLPDLTGSSQALSAHKGKLILLHFGAASTNRTENDHPENALAEKDWTTLAQHHTSWAAQGLRILAVNFSSDAQTPTAHPFPILRGDDDVAAVYNILFRYLFDRHRDIDLPTTFLINPNGEIVKIYQGGLDPTHLEQDFHHIPKTASDRLARALPFPGVTEISEFGRNYLSFGSVYFQRGYFEQAAAAFRIAFEDDPESAEALYGIGSVLLNQQDNAQARDCFQHALKLRATYPDTLANSWNNLGLIAAREGKIAEAIADFQQALHLSPDHLVALNNLGGAYRQAKEWDEAQHTYERTLTLKPADAEANYGLGMVYAQKDDAANAEEYLKRALQLRPAYPEALNNLGILYLRTHRRDEAVASFEKSIEVAPDFDQSYLNLARVHIIEGDAQQAREVLETLLKRHPNHPAAQQMLSQLGQ
jgi:tetratricopeptide (TPR) repeat protein/peroxiredoxin